MITIRKGKAWRVSGKVVNLLEILDRESSTSSAIRALDVLASKAAGLERDLSRGITPWLRPEMRAELIAQGADEEETDAGRWLAITDGKAEEIYA